jgi:tripartite-type tricarboxylate transporter receptor subunit TctC
VAQTGLIKVIAVTNKARSPAMPEVPTVMEVGFPDLSYEAFLGFIGPPSMTEALWRGARHHSP